MKATNFNLLAALNPGIRAAIINEVLEIVNAKTGDQIELTEKDYEKYQDGTLNSFHSAIRKFAREMDPTNNGFNIKTDI